MKKVKDWFVYLLKCADNSLYCGVTKNIENRIQSHNRGTASKYTRTRLPVKLAAVRENLTKEEAFKLEYKIKKLQADEKISALKNVCTSKKQGKEKYGYRKKD